MREMTIRPADIADVPALHALIESAYRGESATKGWTHESYLLGGQRTDPESLSAIINNPSSAMLIAEGESSIAGCVQISNAGKGLGYLGMLAVDPALQAAGIGSLLILAAEAALARDYHCSRAEMTVINIRTELIAYYERRGYAATGEMRPFPYGDVRFGVPQSQNLDFIVLEKEIE